MKDLPLFEKWYERGNAAANSDDLADMVKCEPRLLGQSFKVLNVGLEFEDLHQPGSARILRHLVANHILQGLTG